MTYIQVNEEIGKEARIFAPEGLPPIDLQFERAPDGDGYVAKGWTCKACPDAVIGAGPRWEYRQHPVETKG